VVYASRVFGGPKSTTDMLAFHLNEQDHVFDYFLRATMSFLLKSYALLLVISLGACTHSISHKPIASSLPTAQNDRSLLIVVSPETRAFTETYSNLSGDKWIFNVGGALVDIAPQVFRNQYGSVSVTDSIPSNFTPSAKNQLVVMKIQSFKPDIGWTVFSRHDGTLTLSVEARGKTTVNQTVSGSGSDAGGNYAKTYAALLLPTVGISGYNEAMSVMITNAVTATCANALPVLQQSGQK